MDKEEFVAIKEKLEAMSESFKERFSSVETDIQSLKEQSEKMNGLISNGVQNISILNKLDSFDERIEKLEAFNQAKDTKVVLIL
jgi:hypothetical protein